MPDYTNFRVLHPSVQADRSAVFDELLSSGIANVSPARSILGLFFPDGKQGNSALCPTVIIEEQYVCYDYMDSYVRFYHYAHLDYDKRCRRVHFFAENIEEDELVELSATQRDSYRGFVVVRPTNVYTTGRTVVSPALLTGGQYFVLPQCLYEVNLAGNSLVVSGAVFMQQDTQVAACASASVWMGTTSLSQRFGLPRFTTTQITEMATRSDVSLGRAVPSPGLTVAQMLEAVRSMGYEPILYSPQDSYDHKMAVYKYVESEIPVIVGLSYFNSQGKRSGHSVVVCGHEYRRNDTPSSLTVTRFDQVTNTWVPDFDFHPSVEWVPSFLANDDARGPYQSFEMVAADAPGVPTEITELALREEAGSVARMRPIEQGSGSGEWFAAIIATIVAMPRGISLAAGKAEIKAVRLLSLAHRLLGWQYPTGLVLRTYLCLSNEFKARLSATPSASRELRTLYGDTPLPKFVWVTEISTKDYMNEGEPGGRMSVGEVLIDSSANPHTVDFVVVHVPGYFMRMRPTDSGPDSAILKYSSIADDSPYPHLARPPQF